MKRFITFILLTSILISLFPLSVLSDEMTAYELMCASEDDFILRMARLGVEDEYVKSFVDTIDNVVNSFQESIYAQDLDEYFITVFLQALQKETHISVLVAFDLEYQEEILYMLNYRKVPDCMYNFKTIIFHDKLIYDDSSDDEDDIEEDMDDIFIEEEIIPPEEPVIEIPPLPFDDISTHPWAVESIVYLYEKGVVNGVYEKTYEPDKPITREEFLKMVVEALLTTNTMYDNEFGQKGLGKWYYSYLAAAEFYALIQGIYDEDVFEDGVYITREDMCAIAYRASLRADINLPDIKYSTDFIDNSSCSYYSVWAIKELQEADIIHGMGNNKFEPKLTTTRAEAAKIIHQLMLLKK
ncbi:MAG: S-layer homology domain-containing protein [Clostridia bacterium]|nr:S-layer homology domain-containing protein [Clostridia bacterium]